MMLPAFRSIFTKALYSGKFTLSWSYFLSKCSFSTLNVAIFKIKNHYRCRNSRIRFLSLTIPVNNIICEKLHKRSLLQITGPDSVAVLQGLITNDITTLNNVMYSLMLNTQGRVLYDIILYKREDFSNQNASFWLECDKEVNEDLQKHFKMYRLRKKMDIINVDSEYSLWVIFSPSGQIHPDVNKNQVIICVQDPRIPHLGWRLINKTEIAASDVAKNVKHFSNNCDEYTSLRYHLGVGEGSGDLPPGNCFPMESNGDYLHGVSFRKGCYIGQELTARTFYTGVVRKRLMPLVLEENCEIQFDAKIQNENGKSVGKFRKAVNKVGLGVLRISDSLAAKSLSVIDGNKAIKLTTSVPGWWPSTDAIEDQA